MTPELYAFLYALGCVTALAIITASAMWFDDNIMTFFAANKRDREELASMDNRTPRPQALWKLKEKK